MHFNPRSPCGERHLKKSSAQDYDAISIHAPRAGSDQHPNQTTCCIRYISIHAPRAGSDSAHRRQEQEPGYFNPRSPCGERQQRYTFFHAHLWREQTNTLMGLGYHCVCNTMKEAYFDFLPQKSGANLPGNPAYLGFAAKSSTYLPVDRWFYSQSVPLSSHTDFPDNKSEGCLFRDP